jgi:hypothetical protein
MMKTSNPIHIYNLTADDLNAGIPVPQQRVPVKEVSEIKSSIPERGGSDPVRVGKLLEPLRQIIGHPGRNRLMAELFRDYK